jgi:hypothetical protein
MVELARVPLAIAARTQDAWHIKILAALGVMAAITVTSFSLSQIAWKTFDNRIAKATRTSDRLTETKNKKDVFQNKLFQLQRDIDQKINVRNSVSERLGGLQAQLTKISQHTIETKQPVLGPDGQPIISTSRSTNVSQTQLNAVNGEIASTKKEREIAEATVKQAEEDLKKAETGRVQIDEALLKAESEYRSAVNDSQLHSYTAMFKGKAVAEVTDSEVKNFEKYLIIPSIAAALASTLIALTAVRRVKSSEPVAIATIPDEAAAYLFGPLLQAIRKEANDAVAAAVNGHAKAGPQRNMT